MTFKKEDKSREMNIKFTATYTVTAFETTSKQCWQKKFFLCDLNPWQYTQNIVL